MVDIVKGGGRIPPPSPANGLGKFFHHDGMHARKWPLPLCTLRGSSFFLKMGSSALFCIPFFLLAGRDDGTIKWHTKPHNRTWKITPCLALLLTYFLISTLKDFTSQVKNITKSEIYLMTYFQRECCTKTRLTLKTIPVVQESHKLITS